jgi:hypothetical protein
MELYGSLLNISGSVTASAFTGSFIGDGSGLSGIQASGVTGLNLSQIASGDATASITTSGFTVNKNTQIQGNLSVTGALIANEYIVSSSVIYMTTSFASGSSAFGNDNNDVHQFTGSVQITGSISLNGQAIGTGKLDETTFQSYTSSNNSKVSALETSSGSLNSFTSSINTTIKSKLDSDNVISGSVQVNITGTTGYSTFSSSISNSIDNLSSSVATTTSGLTSTITSLSSSLTSSIGSLSSSIATTDSNQEGRLNALETSSGSLNSFTSSIDTTIKNKLNNDGVISGSSQILNGSNLVSSSTQVTAYGFATTGSNLFKGTQTHSGSILPSVDNAYDLGSVEYQWRDVYISSGSLYIDGTKVLSSTAQELVITTDSGQSIKILEGTTDSIILQTADGDIELKSSADGDILLDPTNGKIMLKGPVEVLSGQKIQSSVGGTPVVFANDIVVSGSIDLTGTIEGIDLTTFSSSVNTRLTNLETSTGSLNSYTSSNTTNINAIHTATSSLNSFTSSINTTIKSKLDGDGVISGSVQVILTGTTGYSTFSSSVSTSIGEISGSIATTTAGLGSTIGSLSSSVATTTSGLSSTITSLSSSVSSSIGSLSSSVATTTSGLSSTITSLSSSVATTTSGLSSTITSLSSSVATYDLGQDNRLTSIEGKTGSYATTGSNIFQGDQTITGSLYVSQNLIIAGSSSIQHISSSVVNIADNIITVNAQNPSIRFGGLAVIDSGSSPQVSGSMLFDSTNDQWIFVHQNQAAVTSSVLLMGPQTINNLGNESYPTTNRVLKSVNAEHVGDSNITDTGTKVSVNSNTEITGSLIVAGGNKLTVNATGGDEGGEILLGKATTNTTLVGEGVTIDIWQNRLRFFEQGGNARGAYLDISSLANGVGTNLLGTAATASYVEYSNVANKPALVSGSSQISFLSVNNIPSGLVSGSSQVLNGSGVWSGSAQLPSGVVSGSSQVLAGTGIWSGSAQLPSGVVSGSSQISFGSITGVPSGLVSGSSQVLAGTTIHSGSFFNGISVVSGSAQISFNGITDKPTLVSGSSQISFGSITGVPGGLVSGSSQIDLTSTTNYSTGIKTRLNAEGVLSGSAQVVAALPSGTVSGSAQIIAGLPSGTVSGSAQVTLSSTSGFGSYLNQAVLTTSSPTFGGMTLTGALGGTSATFSSNVTINGTVIGTDQTFGGAYRTFAFGTNSNGYNRIFAANDTSDGLYLNAATGRGIYFRVNGGGTDVVSISSAGAVTLTGTISASNFSGSSSGTNTGDQTSVSGNAGTVTNGVYTVGTQTIAGEKTFSDRIIYSKPLYRSFDTFAGANDSRRTKTYSGVLVAASDISGAEAYTIIDTNVPQDNFQMGGFTIEIMMNYENTNNKTKVDLGGYWNPESNGGFMGWEAHFSNPGYTPTIQIARKTSTGNVSFIITNSSPSYQIIVARDLWLGYDEQVAESTEKTWGDDWAIIQSANTTAYTNLDTVVNRSSSVSAGTGISVNTTTNAVTVTNTGTLTVAGTTNQVLINGSTAAANGNITLSLPQSIGTGSTPTFSTVTATTFTGALSGNASSSSALSGGGNLTTAPTTNQLFYTGQISSNATGLFPASDNANSIITLNRHPGAYDSQLGFSSNGNLYYRNFVNTAINTSQGWQTIWTSTSLTNLNQLTNGPGYITGISFANVSSKPTTLSGYGITDALSNSSDSEQDVGTRNLYYNDGVKRVFSDPRWNESGYDGDLGTLHIYSTTAAGANYGRAGIALYNGSAYQYLTTKGSTTGLFANNSLILTAGNYTSYAMAGAGYSANQNLSTTSTVTFGNLRVGSGGSTNGGVLNVTGANDNQVNITHDSTWGLLLGYCNEGSASGYHGPNHAAIINVRNASLHFGINNSSNVQISSGGHFHPSANNTYDCGTSSLAWRNVYTNDLHLSNMNKPEGNDVDGTNGNWTIQEGAENLYIINNNNGKKFKISLEEII